MPARCRDDIRAVQFWRSLPGCSMRVAVGCRHEHARGLPSRGAVLGRHQPARPRRRRPVLFRALRVHCAVRLGDAHARLLPARRVPSGSGQAARRGAGHVRLRQGQRGRAAGRAAAAGQPGRTRWCWPRSRMSRAARPAPPPRCCCCSASRSRSGWCRSRSGCRAATPPPPARPARSWPGSAVNVGFYGMWRTLALLGPPPGWLTGGAAGAGRG